MKTKPVIYGGYWYDKSSKEGKKLPKPLALDKPFFDKSYLIKRIKSLQSQASFNHYKGTSECRICGERNGSGEYELKNKAGTIIWPEGLLHYIRKHNVRPSQEFITAITPYELPPKMENKPTKVEDTVKRKPGRPKKIVSNKPHIDQVFGAFHHFGNQSVIAGANIAKHKAARVNFKQKMKDFGLYDHIDWTEK